MATNDRSRQQSAEAPQSGAQQGAWQSGQRGQQEGSGQSMPARGGQQGGRGMPAQRGSYDPAYYGGYGGPFSLMRRISDEMDRLFESFGMGGPLARSMGGGLQGEGGLQSLWSPHIELSERDGRLVIQADLPGVRKEDVNVQVEDDRVVIQGERRQESRREEQGYFHTERSYGSFYREIPLPEGIDSEQAKASFHDGVLEIELPAPKQRQRGRALTIEDRGGGGGGQSKGGTGGGTDGTAGKSGQASG